MAYDGRIIDEMAAELLGPPATAATQPATTATPIDTALPEAPAAPVSPTIPDAAPMVQEDSMGTTEQPFIPSQASPVFQAPQASPTSPQPPPTFKASQIDALAEQIFGPAPEPRTATTRRMASASRGLAGGLSDGGMGIGPQGGVVRGYDISRYATDPRHEQSVARYANELSSLNSIEAIDAHIQSVAPGSPVTGSMVASSASRYNVDPFVVLALMRQDSSYGTLGKGARTFNPGNVGNDDAGNMKNFGDWQRGVDAVAGWLSRHKAGSSGGLLGLQPFTANAPPASLETRRRALGLIGMQTPEDIAAQKRREAWESSVDDMATEILGPPGVGMAEKDKESTEAKLAGMGVIGKALATGGIAGVASLLRSYRHEGPRAEAESIDKAIKYFERPANEFAKAHEDDKRTIFGIKLKDIADLAPGLGATAGTLAVAVPVAVATTAATAPFLGPASPWVGRSAGMAAAAATLPIAKRADEDQLFESIKDVLDNESMKQRGSKLTQDELDAVREKYKEKISQHGWWEGLTESADTALDFAISLTPAKKFMAPVAKLFQSPSVQALLKNRIVGMAGKLTAMMGSEMAQEAVTAAGVPGMRDTLGGGQADIEHAVGLRKPYQGWVEEAIPAAKQAALQTAITFPLFQAGGHLARKYRDRGKGGESDAGREDSTEHPSTPPSEQESITESSPPQAPQPPPSRTYLQGIDKQPLPTTRLDLEAEYQYLEGIAKSPPQNLDVEAFRRRRSQIVNALNAENLYDQRLAPRVQMPTKAQLEQAWLGTQDSLFAETETPSQAKPETQQPEATQSTNPKEAWRGIVPNLLKMSKDEMVRYAQENQIELPEKAGKLKAMQAIKDHYMKGVSGEQPATTTEPPPSRPIDTTGTAATTASVKMFLTKADIAALKNLGWDDASINKMKPEEGARIISEAMKGEAPNAQGIRSDEGQVYPGGNVQRQGLREGGQDLEFPKSEEPGGEAARQGAAEEVGQEEPAGLEGQKTREGLEREAPPLQGEQTEQEDPTAIAKQSLKTPLDIAAHEAASSPLNDKPQPTTPQIKADNAELGHFSFQGIPISIESPIGSVRKDVNHDPPKWQRVIKEAHYGRIKGVRGRDKDLLDVFVRTDNMQPAPEGSDNEAGRTGKAFVVDQIDPETGKFDELKVVLGAKDEQQARKTYLANYPEGWQGLGAITEFTIPEFKAWLRGGDATKRVGKKAPKEIETDKGVVKQKEDVDLPFAAGLAEQLAERKRMDQMASAPKTRIELMGKLKDGTANGVFVLGDDQLDLWWLPGNYAKDVRGYSGLDLIRLARTGMEPGAIYLRHPGWYAQNPTPEERKVIDEIVKFLGKDAPDRPGEFVDIQDIINAKRDKGKEPASAPPVTPKQTRTGPTAETAARKPLKEKTEPVTVAEKGESTKKEEAPPSSRPTPSTPAQPAPSAPPTLTVSDLDTKSIIVKGDYTANKDRIAPVLKQHSGLYNGKHKGWVFPKKNEAAVRAALGIGAEQKAEQPPPSRETEQVVSALDQTKEKALARYVEGMKQYLGEERAEERGRYWIDKIDSKDVVTLRETMNGINPELNRLFSTITGLPAKTQKDADASLRSLNPNKWDEWQGDKKREREKKESDRAEKIKKDAEDQVLDEKVSYNGNVTTRRDIYQNMVASGYTQIETRRRGVVDEFFLVNPKTEMQVKVPKPAVDFVRGLVDAVEAKRDKTSDLPDISEEDADHLFGTKKKPEPATQPETQRIVVGKNRDGDTIYSDDKGARYILEGGMRVQSFVLRPGYIDEQFMTVEEVDAKKPRSEDALAEPITPSRPATTKSMADASREDVMAELRNQMKEREEKAAPAVIPAAVPMKETTPTAKLESAADHMKAIADGIKKINAIFGEEGSFSTAPISSSASSTAPISSSKLDETKWRQIRPILDEMWGHAVATGQDVKDFVSLVLDSLSLKAAPYFERFIEEKFSGNEEVSTQKGESDADTASPGQQEASDQGVVGDLQEEGLRPDEEERDAESVRGGLGQPDEGGISPGDRSDSERVDSRENPGNQRGIDAIPDPDQGGVGEDISQAPAGKGRERGKGGVTTKPAKKKGNDYSAPVGSLKREGSWLDTAKRSVEIIELAVKIDAEKRTATPAEQELLSKYVGFGAGEIRNKLFPAHSNTPLTQIWPNYSIYDQSWKDLAERLSKLPEQWQKTLLQSTQYAHYTSEGVTRQMWEAAKHLGFTGGHVLEPGMGIGNFFMTMPEGLRKVSTFTGIEFDGPTALIAKHLLPRQQVLHDDYTKRKLPKNFFDFAIGNPPFASIPITNDPDYAKHEFSLHDYFFAKTVDLVRPGGMVAFVTSRHTMDRQGDKARRYLQERADLIGAIRLPQMAFQDNAGTSVVTDVLFFRKRQEGEEQNGNAWSKRVEIETKDGPVNINEYYAAHPEMILGQVRKTGHTDDVGRRIGGERGYDQPTVISYYEDYADLDAAFAEAVKKLPSNVFSITTKDAESIKRETEAIEFNPKVRREGALYLDEKGNVRRVQGGVGVDFFKGATPLLESKREWFKDFVSLKGAVNAARFDQYNDGPWEASLKKLQSAYNKFRTKHGPILDFTTRTTTRTDEDGNEYQIQSRTFKNKRFWDQDYDSALITQLEKITEEGEIVKSAFLTERTIGKPVQAEVKTIHDAMAVSLDAVGKLDLNDIATRMGISQEDAIETLDDLIYRDVSGEWMLADEYLSGDVVRKLDEARTAAELDPSLQRNVEALQKVQPTPLGHSQIRVLLGAGWIPDRYVTEFASEILNAGEASYDRRTETWTVAGGNMRSERRSGNEYGTNGRSPSEILEAVLNGRRIVVKRTEKDASGRTYTYTDKESTEAVNDITKKMKEKFSSWIWTDSARTSDLLDVYNRTKNNIAPRRFNGSHLTLPGVSLKYKLHDHQKRAVWRIIQTGDTYLGHAVGAGKTLEMISAGMEMKRLGLVKRPWYVVPNHMLEQFANEFMDLYPLANIMVADKEAFHKDKRKEFVAQATLNNPDAVIVTHSAFERIGVKEESVAPIREKLVTELTEALDDTEDSDRIRRSALQRQIEIVERRFDSITGSSGKDVAITFEETGCDFLFVDEAHNYRKLDFHTNRKLKGIDPNGARKSMDMYVKVKFLDSKNPGRSHVFASGTPLTNTIGEMYSLMRFFIEDRMQEEGMSTFDGWASTFGDSKISLEPNAAGNYENVERFATFVNVPELMSRVRSFMDVLTSDQLGSIVKRPDLEGGKPEIIAVPSTPEQEDYRSGPLSERVAASKRWKPSFQQRNNPDPMIAIISEGRKASIDPRFFDHTISEKTPSKLNRMADEIIAEHKRTKLFTFEGIDGKQEAKKGGVQIVFYNLGFGAQLRAKNAFDARDALTRRLTAGGIKRDEIAWFDDADTDAKKERVFKEARLGNIRVVIGSAKKMGTGVNIQKRLTAMHYLDPPWYPADFEQPQGRIIRQGNQNETVRVKLYATKGSYDETMWSMVARKQKQIDQAFSGDASVRSIEDISEASSYEMAAALASGDQRILQLAGLNQDIDRLDRLAAAHASSQHAIAYDLDNIQRYQLPGRRERLAKLKEAKNFADDSYATYKSGSVEGRSFDHKQKDEFGAAIKAAYNKAIVDHAATLKKNSKSGWRVVATIGKVNDKYPLRVNVYQWDESIDAAELELGIGPLWFEIQTGKVLNETVSDSGLITKSINIVNRLPRDIREVEDTIEEHETEVKRLSKVLGAPFEYEAERADKIAEKNRLEAELVSEGVAANAPHQNAPPPGVISQSGSGEVIEEEESPRTTYRTGPTPGAATGYTNLYSGFPVDELIREIRAAKAGIESLLPGQISDIMPRLTDLGTRIIARGFDTARTFKEELSRVLGDAFDAVRRYVLKIFAAAQRAYAKLPDAVKNEWGTFAGPKAQWWDKAEGKFTSLYDKREKVEIDDSKMVVDEDFLNRKRSKTYVLSDIVEHPELFENYPEAMNIKVKLTPLRGYGGNMGGNTMEIATDSDKADRRQTIIHELQHWIQGREGFAVGGSVGTVLRSSPFSAKQEGLVDHLINALHSESWPKGNALHGLSPIERVDWFVNREIQRGMSESKAMEARDYTLSLPGDRKKAERQFEKDISEKRISRKSDYMRMAGEIEARDATSRGSMSTEQRRATPPYSSENIAPEDAIVRFGGGEAQMSATEDTAEESRAQRRRLEKNQGQQRLFDEGGKARDLPTAKQERSDRGTEGRETSPVQVEQSITSLPEYRKVIKKHIKEEGILKRPDTYVIQNADTDDKPTLVVVTGKVGDPKKVSTYDLSKMSPGGLRQVKKWADTARPGKAPLFPADNVYPLRHTPPQMAKPDYKPGQKSEPYRFLNQKTGKMESSATPASRVQFAIAPKDLPESAKAKLAGTRVVDENGELKLVYHGTPNADFQQFDLSLAGKSTKAKSAKEGIWFASRPETAETYSGFEQEPGSTGGPGIGQYYLKMTNPKIIDMDDLFKNNIERFDSISIAYEMKLAKQEGYDGLILKNNFDTGPKKLFDREAFKKTRRMPQDMYAVFSPDQIVSVLSPEASVKGSFKEAPIVGYRREAKSIESSLPPIKEGMTRLWRGNREGEVGTATQFTNDLPGIAIPFRNMYGGGLSYVDVPTKDLTKYEQRVAAAPGAEFNLPDELARNARNVSGIGMEGEKATTEINESRNSPLANEAGFIRLPSLGNISQSATDQLAGTLLSIRNLFHPKDASLIGSILQSPEYRKNLQEKDAFEATQFREERRHEIFIDHKEPIDLMAGMKFANATKLGGKINMGRFKTYDRYNINDPKNSHLPRDYRQTWKIIDDMDAKEISWKDYKEKLIARNKERARSGKGEAVSSRVISAIDKIRSSYDDLLEYMRRPIKEVIDYLDEQARKKAEQGVTGEEVDDPAIEIPLGNGKTKKYRKSELMEMYMSMGQLKGFYAPRIRAPGDYFVRGKDAEGNFYRYHTPREDQAEILRRQLERRGFTNLETGNIAKLPESIYQDISIIDMGKAIEYSVSKADINDPNVRAQMQAEILSSASNMLKARAFRSHKIARQNRGEMARYILEGTGADAKWTLREDWKSYTPGKAAKDGRPAEAPRMPSGIVIDSIPLSREEREALSASPSPSPSPSSPSPGKKKTKLMRVGWTPPVKGYIEDPLERYTIYLSQISGGVAKGEAGKKMYAALMAVDAANERERYKRLKNYITEQLRNPDAWDRRIAMGKSIISFKYLGLNPRSAFVNTTATVTTAPPAILKYTLGNDGSLMEILGAIKTAAVDYVSVMRGGSLKNKDEQAFMDEIYQKGYASPQLTRDAMRNVQGAFGNTWGKIMDASMWGFGKTEQWNRGTTMLAAYRLARKQGQTHEKAMKGAREASDRAHGVYGRATLPSWALGDNPFAKIAQLAYTYQKFGHNYFQMLTDMGADMGADRKSIKAFAFALGAPAVVGGGKAFIGYKALMIALGVILSQLGMGDDDPEKWIYDTIRRELGSAAEVTARYGLVGAGGYGFDISSSLAVGMELPRTFSDLIGPFGGIYKNVEQASKFALQGQGWRAGEELAPSFLGNVMRAHREFVEGGSTKSLNPIWDENGKIYQPKGREIAGKVVGFTSAERSTIQARTWESKKEVANYAEKRKRIYAAYRGYLLDPERSKEEEKRIYKLIEEYNEGVTARKKQALIPYVTPESLRRETKNIMEPSRRERALLAE